MHADGASDVDAAVAMENDDPDVSTRLIHDDSDEVPSVVSTGRSVVSSSMLSD